MNVRGFLGGRGLLALAFAAPIAARALSYQDSLLDRDEAYWLASALRMRDEGLPPYLGGWDTKPPLVFLFFRLAVAISPGTPLLAAHVLTGVVAGIACAFVAAAARRLAGAGAGGISGAVAAALFTLLDSTGVVKSLAANTEILTYVPVAAMAWLLAAAESGGRVRGPALAAAVGACGALAGLGRHTALANLPFGVASLFLLRERPRLLPTLLAAGCGAAAVLGVTALWLLAAGAWDDAVGCLWTAAVRRAELGVHLANTESYGRWLGVADANPLAVLGVLGAVAAASLGPAEERTSARAALRLAGPLTIAGALAAVAGGAAFLHYLLQAYVATSVLAGVGLVAAVRSVPAPRLRAVLAVVAALGCALAAAADRRVQWRRRAAPRYDAGGPAQVAAMLQGLVPEDGRLFVWGMHPDLYITARRTPATRFNATGWLVGTYTGGAPPAGVEPQEIVPGSWDWLFADLDARPPDAVVDSAPTGVHHFEAWPLARFDRLRAWVEERYVAVPDAPGGYLVWKRR